MKIRRKAMTFLSLLLAVMLCWSTTTDGQTVSLNRKSISLENLFKEIREQTGYEFLYNIEMLENVAPVTIQVKDVPVKKLLDDCLKDKPLTYQILEDKTIVIRRKQSDKTAPATSPKPQPKKVEGRVKDDLGQPIEGVSVQLKHHPRTGTFTDETGRYSLDVSLEPPDTLVFTYVGYQSKEVVANGNSAIQVSLSALEQERESVMVSTGYQEINRDNYTGTAVTVSGDELKKVNPQSILQSLQVFDPSFKIAENNLAGSNPNSLPNINVRGSTALPSGSSSDIISRNNLSGTVNMPTFILDGYEVGVEKIFDLDINRVKSVTLLKDAAATAIYGSRAANGVVVVTTKAPKEGKLSVTYNFDLNVSTPDLSAYHVLNATQKLAYEKLAGLYETANNLGLSQDQLDDLYYQKMARVLSGVNTDWLSQPVHSAIGQKHSLYIEGGSSTFRYGLGFRYQSAPGVMKGSSRDRYSTDMSLSYNMGGKLLFKNSLTVTKTDAVESPYGNFSDYVRMNPYYPLRDSGGHLLQTVDQWQNLGGSIGVTPVLNPMYNATLGGFDKSEYLELIDAFSADWTITRGLRLKGLISINQTRSTGNHFISPFANEFYFYSADDVQKRGQYDYNNTIETSVDGSLTLNYNRRIGGHFINMVVGSNLRTYKSDYKAFTAVGFSNDHFSDLGFAGGYAEGATPYSDVQQQRLVGAFTSVNYSYEDKYLMDFTFREDGSSAFGADNRIAPFTAFGLGWNLHKEAFLKGSAISRLKIRASTGLTGSVSFSPYMAQTTYNYYLSNWYATGAGATVSNYGNDLLQWQKTRNYDLGLELGFLGDRLLFMPRYYYKLTKGLIADVTLPPSTGFSSYKDNIGDMRNTGWELSFQYGVLRTKDIDVNLTTNLVHNQNIIVRISDALKAYNNTVDDAQNASQNQGVPLLHYVEGQSLNTIYAVKSLGIDPENGREIFVKKDGSVTYDWDPKDITAVGVEQPVAEGYFGSSVRYKRFNLNFNFYTRWGGQHYNQTLVDRVENADPHYNVDSRVFADKWKAPGDQTFYKNIADLGQTQTSSRFVQNDNTLELQSLYLSYDVPENFFKRTGMKNLRFALTMNDLLRWSSITQERGIEYPFARSFTFSLTTNF